MKKLLICFLLIVVCTLPAFATTIHITQTTGQYVCNQKNATYILDNDLTATGTAIVIAADTVTLDLNGHTVTFGTAGGDNRYGVAFAGYAMGSFPDVSNYNWTDSCVIKNGRIVHGTTLKPKGCAAIYSPDGSSSNIAVKNVYCYVKGIDAQGIYFERGHSFDIENDSVEMAVDSITNRMATKPAIGLDKWAGYGYVKNNELYGNGQVGINFTTTKSSAVTAAEISGNKIHINGVTTNPYSMIITGISYERQGVRLLLHHNRITADGDISNRGIDFEGIYGGTNTGVDGARVYSNYINTKSHGYFEEGVDGLDHAFRMREEDGASGEKFWDNQFYNDTIIVNGYWVDENIHGNGYAIRISLVSISTHSAGNIFYDNVIIANSQDTHLQCRSYAIGIDGHDGTQRTQFYNNIITSNAKIFRFASSGGDSVMFRSNTVNKGANPCHFSTFLYDTWTNNSVGNKFLDNTLGSGISYTDIEKSAGAGESRNFLVKWYLHITVVDSLDNPLSNAGVRIKNKDSTVVFCDTTAEDGELSASLTEYFYNVQTSTATQYNPFVILTYKGADSSDTVMTVADSSRHLTLKLQTGGGTPDITPPANVTGVDTSLVTSSIVNLFCDKNDSADCQGYRVVWAYGSTAPATYNSGTLGAETYSRNDTTFSIVGLSPNTQYSFSIFAKDEAGNWSVKATGSWKTVTTKTASDNTPPDTVSGVDTLSVTSTSVILVCAKSDSTDCTGYMVRYRTGSSAPLYYNSYSFGDSTSAIGDTTFTINGLSPNTQYTFSIFAKDAFNNWTVKGSESWITITTKGYPIPFGKKCGRK